LNSFHHLQLSARSDRSIRLAIQSDAVAVVGDPELRRQGYRLTVVQGGVEIIGNGDPGLLYGVQTLLQLLKREADGSLTLPLVSMEDWPKLELRFLHWDTKNHQDRTETLKRYLDWSVRFKVNMIGFELEDKFAYPSLPEIGAPGAFTPTELQEIVNYGLERFIQVVPVIQAPAHMSYVLKHPKFAHLRADGNNYQACLCDDETYRLIFKMYDDVVNATKGVEYFFASTDEVYYAGICSKCNRPYDPDTRSQTLLEFDKRAHDHLASRGRRMLAWLEYPLLPKHLEEMPSGIIDGVMGNAAFAPIERRKGMRQLIYVSLQGSEFLFPDYFSLEPELRDTAAPVEDDPLEFERGLSTGRVQEIFDAIAGAPAWKVNPIGAFGAAWDDSGLHNETFWLGWAAAARYAWNPTAPSPQQHTAEFMDVYYGPHTVGMADIYRSLQRQARAWQRTWERVVSKTRGPGYGNSEGKGIGTTRYDQTLTLPTLPSGPSLDFAPAFANSHRAFLAQAQARALESDRLVHAIQENFGRVTRNQYNLEVLLALTQYVNHHWSLITGLAQMERWLELAHQAANSKPMEALVRLSDTYKLSVSLEAQGRDRFAMLGNVFEKSRFPKGRSVGARLYFHGLDDTKDHWAARTANLDYMYAPERNMHLQDWSRELRSRMEAFSKSKNLPMPALD
jgi:hypothetical protein